MPGDKRYWDGSQWIERRDSPPTGDLLTGGGALLLLITLFLPWYRVSTAEFSFDSGGQSKTVNAWSALDVIDIVLLVVALAVLALVILDLVGARPTALTVPRGSVILGLGAIALVLVVFRLIDLPNEVTIDGVSDSLDELLDEGVIDVSRSPGIFLALLSGGAMALGGWLSSKDEK